MVLAIALLVAVVIVVLLVRLLPRGYETVAPLRAAELLRDRNVFLLDVRTKGESRFSGRIPGARLIPMTELERDLETIPGDRPVMVYCASGLRSRLAARRLSGRVKGAKVYNLAGGLGAWQRAGLPMER